MNFARVLFSRRALIVAAFLFTSVINVRVKAEPVELPRGCWQHIKRFQACAFLNDQTLKSFQLSIGRLRMSAEASVVVDRSTLHLVRGIFWLNATEPVVIKTLYGNIRLTNGTALIVAQDRKVNVTNLSSDLIYRPRGSHVALHLPKGMAVQMGRVSQSGVAETGFPHAPMIKDLLAAWTKVYSQNDLANLHSEVAQFIPFWLAATSEIGPWYAQIVEREVASAKSARERLARQRARERAEDLKVLKLFRAQNFIPN